MTREHPGILHQMRSRRFPKGGWVVRYRDPDNRTLRRTFGTRQEALDFQAGVRTDIRRGDWLDPRKAQTRFRDVAEAWYATTAGLKPSTRRSYRLTLDAHILPALGDKAIGKVTPSVLRAFLAGLPEHLAPKTKWNIFRVLSPILKLAVVDGMIRENPARFVKLPKLDRREMSVLTAEQVVTLAEAINPSYQTLVYTAAYTGMRAGELAALRVKNLDLLRGRVTVASSLSDVNGKLHFVPPKNGKVRAFSIPAFLIDMLAAHLAARPHEPDDLVFTGAQGRPFRHANFYNRHFKRAVRQILPAHLQGLRFHDLRHTCASLLIANNVHAKAISERLGHSSIAITMDRYGHLYKEHQAEIADKLEATFNAAVGGAMVPAKSQVVQMPLHHE